MADAQVEERKGKWLMQGPFKHPGDVHPCFTVLHDDIGIVAAFYAPDSEDAAETRALQYLASSTTMIPDKDEEITALRELLREKSDEIERLLEVLKQVASRAHAAISDT